MLCPDCGYTYFTNSKKCSSCGANIRQVKTHLELAQEHAFAIYEGEGYAPAGVGDEEAYEHYGVEEEAEIADEGDYGEGEEMATAEGYFTDIGPDDFELDLSEAIGQADIEGEEYGEYGAAAETMDYATDSEDTASYEAPADDYAEDTADLDFEADTAEVSVDDDAEGLGLGFEETEDEGGVELDLGDDDAGGVELDLGDDDASGVELDLGDDDAGGVELDLGDDDAGGVELDLGDDDAGGVELDLGDDDAGGVELDLGDDDAGGVELDLGGDDDLDLGVDLDTGDDDTEAAADDGLDLDLDGLELDMDAEDEEKE